MSDFKIGIQCSEYMQRGGIATYSNRLNRYLNEIDGVKSKIFMYKYRGDSPDVISVQYEPGLIRPQDFQKLLMEYQFNPLVVTVHHIGYLPQVFDSLDGVVVHDKGQIDFLGKKPLDYCEIPHPALVYSKKDKKKLRKKFGLPQDKKIIGTMGFICGTGKLLPITVKEILERLKDDEFLFLMTSFWKGGDMGRLDQILNVVKELGKEDNFKINTDFVSDEEKLNEMMQACDLLYAWNNMDKNQPGSQSGSAADMYGSRTKLIVKDCPHYSFIGEQDKVVVGREKPEEFAEDVIKTLRESDLDNTQDPTWLSWEEQVKKYLDYFKEISEI